MSAVGWDTPLLASVYPDPDCGCPVEEWVYRGINMTLHYEPDGSMEVFADTGDWDAEVPIKATQIEVGRREMFAWADALPVLDA